MKLGYFADGPWAHRALEKIAQDDRFELSFIVPRYDARDPVLADWANELGIDFLPIENVNRSADVEILKAYGADIFVSMSFNQILKKEIINLPRLGFINCHAGALPYYRGRNVLNWALINDASEFGVTVHYIDEGIDTGDIIVQKFSPISDRDTYKTLLDRAVVMCAEALHEALGSLHAGSTKRLSQSDIDPVGFYCGRRVEGDELIEWSWPSRRIFNFVRGIASPGPCARTFLGASEIVIGDAAMIAGAPEYIGTPGEIVRVVQRGIVVKTGDTTILLKDIAGAENFRFRIGQRLGVSNQTGLLLELRRRIEELERLIK